jgi:hypothetical protein
MRYPAGELDNLLTAADFAERVGDDLAVLAGDDLGQLLLARVEQFPEGEHDRGAFGQRGVAPRGKRGGSRVNDRAGIAHTAQRDLTGDLAGRRVGHRRRRTGVPGEGVVVDPVGDGFHGHAP